MSQKFRRRQKTHTEQKPKKTTVIQKERIICGRQEKVKETPILFKQRFEKPSQNLA